MIRISVQVIGSSAPSKLLLFDPYSVNFSQFIKVCGAKLGTGYSGCAEEDVRVYLRGLSEDRVQVEDVGEVRDGDVIMLEKMSTSLRNAPEKNFTREVNDNCNDDGDEVEIVDMKPVPHVVIDLCDDESDSDDDMPPAPTRYSWMKRRDEELLTSEEEDQDQDQDEDGDEEEAEEDGQGYRSSGARAARGRSGRVKEEGAGKVHQSSRAPRKKCARRPWTSPAGAAGKQPIYGFIDAADLPMAPGTLDPLVDGDETTDPSSFSSGAATPDNSLPKIKARIAKMLQLGLHPSTSEAEAQHAMRVAQKLLHKFNLTQAAVLLAHENRSGAQVGGVEALQGGLVEVRLRRVARPGQASREETTTGERYVPATTSTWIVVLAAAVADNFQVKNYYNSPTCTFTFYGLKTSAQVAAYAFKVAVEKIAIMKEAFAPPPGEFEDKLRRGCTSCASKGGYTLSSRNSYCEGMVCGIRDFVQSCQREEQGVRAEKLAKAREQAASGKRQRGPGEDRDDDRDDDSEEEEEQGGGWDDCAAEQMSGDGAESISPLHPKKRARPDAGQGDEVHRLEAEEQVSSALTLHTEDVAAKILKDKDIKVRRVKRAGRLEVNHGAWAKGINDSKEINLNERAIKSK